MASDIEENEYGIKTYVVDNVYRVYEYTKNEDNARSYEINSEEQLVEKAMSLLEELNVMEEYITNLSNDELIKYLEVDEIYTLTT